MNHERNRQEAKKIYSWSRKSEEAEQAMAYIALERSTEDRKEIEKGLSIYQMFCDFITDEEATTAKAKAMLKSGTEVKQCLVYILFLAIRGRLRKEIFTKDEIANFLKSQSVCGAVGRPIMTGKLHAYLPFYIDMEEYAAKLDKVYQGYLLRVSELARLIDKYETLEGNTMLYELLYSCVTHKRGKTGIKYSLVDNIPQKSLDDTTPEGLLAEMNDLHKDDGVKYIVTKNAQGEDEVKANMQYNGGLRERLVTKAAECATWLSYVKAYITTIEDYVGKYYLTPFIPVEMAQNIENVKGEKYTQKTIAREYHLSEINKKRAEGKAVSIEEVQMALVPDYEETTPNELVAQSCIHWLKLKKYEDDEE